MWQRWGVEASCDCALANVGQYLFTRLKQVGVESIHGVPGDYNLVALDYIPKTGLKWVGNCNELNAGMFDSLTFDTLPNFAQDTQQMVTQE
jgi:hypothetical protein